MASPVTQRPKFQARAAIQGPYTVEASGFQKIHGETLPRRNIKAKDALRSRPCPQVSTVFELLQYATEKHGDGPCVGTRKVVDMHTETEVVKHTLAGAPMHTQKQWTTWELGPYEWQSFAQFREQSLRYGVGLRALGLAAGDRIHVYAPTSAHWSAIAHGAFSNSMTVVTAYDSLGKDGLSHSLEETRPKAVFADPSLLDRLAVAFEIGTTTVRWIIYDDNIPVDQEAIGRLKRLVPHLTTLDIRELELLSAGADYSPIKPKPEDLACIMYTSGSSGKPKGVTISHKNVVAGVAGIDPIFGQHMGPGDIVLAFLPLAHIFEFVFECAALYWGVARGYGNPKTLTAVNLRNCRGDLAELRPTILIGVPQVFENLKKGILAKVEQAGLIKSSIFWAASFVKNCVLATGLPGADLIDATVLKNAKDALGGRVRLCLNGGGPIAVETRRFVSTVLAPMTIGYGMTETCAMGGLMDPDCYNDMAVGEMPVSVEIKLVDQPELGYFTSTTPPQGEICIRGDAVSGGYLNRPEETRETFSPEGWLFTGDIGEFDVDGNLKIIDRRKNLVKNSNGEYIALEKLESTYKTHPAIQNVCVHASSNHTRPVAIVVVAEAAVQALASQFGLKGSRFEQFVHDKKLPGVLLGQLQEIGRKIGLASFELPQGIVLAKEEWTADNGFTTAASKLVRMAIHGKYHEDIEAVYKSTMIS